MLTTLGKFALGFIIAFTIINTMVQVDLMSVGYQQIPYFTTIVNPQAFTAIITVLQSRTCRLPSSFTQ